jgi:hypothetical protein
MDGCNEIGVSPGAGAEGTPWHRSDPPLTPGAGISVYIPHEGEAGVRRLCRDIRPLGNDDSPQPGSGYVWPLDLIKNFEESGAADDVLLSFTGVEEIPPDLRVLLRDRTLRHETDLRETAEYRFYMGKRGYVGSYDARFELLVGTRSFVERTGGQPAPILATRLLPCRPNPTRSGTVIRYEIARPGPVEVSIFDVLGRLVMTLDQGHRESGRYEAAWTGMSGDGQRVRPGVYFYRLRTPGFTATRKLIRL